MEEGFVEVTGGKVWYHKHDRQHTGATPVIVLHGGPGSSCHSLEGLKKLSEDRPVFLYDQLGCGRSDRPEDDALWTIDRFVEEVAQIREALNLNEVHILGHSWGTTLAAAYCLTTKPAGVKSVIFSSPCLSAPLWEQDQERNLLKLPKDVQITLKTCEENGTTDSEEYKKATEVFNQNFVCRLDPYPEHLQNKEYRNPHIYNLMWGPSEFFVTGNLKGYDCTPRLSEITCPTLYTCGRFDEATPETTQYYSSLTPESKFHVFEHSAHMPYVEENEEYLRVVGEFMRAVDQR